MARLPRVTILQLDPTDPPGPLMGWLTDAGTRPAIVAVWESGVPTIGTIGDGLVVLGGPMSAHSQAEHPWLVDLAHLVVDAHTAALPTLGVCLGHQVMADALGGEVVVGHPDGPEEGAVALEVLAAGVDDPILGLLDGALVAESHHDAVVRLPERAVELARSKRFANQAFRLGSSWGVQFHPEATPDLFVAWTRTSADPEAVLASVRGAGAELAASGRLVAEGFARVVHG